MRILIVGIFFFVNLLSAIEYECGKKIYYPSGKLKSEKCHDKKGKSIVKGYHQYSGLIESIHYYDENSSLILLKKYYVGQLDYEETYLNGQVLETKNYYLNTGKLKKIHNQKLDITYYPNGQIAIDGNKTYPSGDAFTDVYKVMYFPMREPIDKKERKKMVGKPYRTIEHNYDYRHYGVNGDIRKMIPYRDDKKNGLAISRPHGKPYIKVTIYKDGKKDGYETLYRRGGVLTYEMIQNLLRGDITLKELNLTDEMVVKKTLYKKGKKVNE